MEAIHKPSLRTQAIDRRLNRSDIAGRLRRIDQILPELRARLNPCVLCPRRCAARRLQGELGECGANAHLKVASVALHKGEEPPISGDLGAINVFFSGCNLHCLHCQNWPISQLYVGRELRPQTLADRILSKWQRGANALGWVTPTPQIVSALEAYRLCLLAGLDLPLVHNGGGYEDAEVVALLADIVDIWLPDAKTADPQRGRMIQTAEDYPQINLRAIAAMIRQVESGEARAVIVRHLILPDASADSRMVLKRLWDNFGDRIHLSLMSQYFPAFRTERHESLGRPLEDEEYEANVAYAQELGFRHGWIQHREDQHGVPLHCL